MWEYENKVNSLYVNGQNPLEPLDWAFFKDKDLFNKLEDQFRKCIYEVVFNLHKLKNTVKNCNQAYNDKLKGLSQEKSESILKKLKVQQKDHVFEYICSSNFINFI